MKEIIEMLLMILENRKSEIKGLNNGIWHETARVHGKETKGLAWKTVSTQKCHVPQMKLALLTICSNPFKSVLELVSTNHKSCL